MEKELPNLEELQLEATDFAKGLTPVAEHATFVTLSGELGAGKTSFTQGMADALGVEDSITSPTFVLQKIYELNGQAFEQLVHMDAYRLEGADSLQPLGFAELYADPGNLIVLEWPELVEGQLPTPDHYVQLTVSGEGRHIIYA